MAEPEKGGDSNDPMPEDHPGMGMQPGEEPEPPDMPEETPEEDERSTV